ncbi:MAG: 3-isopropylmalate dehydratase small subunit [Acetobacteraceae bacterium]
MQHQANDRRILRVSGRAVALRGDDIDTDQILPARFLKAVTFRGMEAHVFADERAAARRENRVHPLDDPRSAGARLLFVNRNFGCGSSREHAPQALHRFGFKAIVGCSFGEIFAGNCVAIGMVCVEADAETMAALQRLSETAPATEAVLDLTALTISAGGQVFPVTLAGGRRRQFLEGTWDPTAILLAAGPAIERTLADAQSLRS